MLFVISGLAFFLGVKSESGAEIKKWQVPFVSAKQELDFLLNFLKQNKIPLPSKIEPRKRREALIIGTAGYEINLSSQGNTSTITSIKRNFLGVLMQIHKGRAGKALVGFGLCLWGVFMFVLCQRAFNGFKIQKFKRDCHRLYFRLCGVSSLDCRIAIASLSF
ncbi:hypothetical protein [Helicobacter suis]|uniref:hypothetical protein n=1 Tax=Helicobacter suis TaxID=104628 RepID=UPI0024932467|nr:hypothetical protein [Helicobacter suis]